MDELVGEADWRLSWHSFLPPAALAATMALAWLWHSAPRGMTSWGVSASGLAQGRYDTILLHMFAHGSGLHLLMNSAALLEIGGLLVARLGGFPKGWLRFSIAFAMSGLSSMILFLSVHPSGRVPMIGASGAVYGLMGLLLFIRLSEELDAASIAEVPVAFARFVQNNLFFLFLLVLSGLLAGYSGGIAWEGHLGGFLFGFCVGPWLSPPLGGAKGG